MGEKYVVTNSIGKYYIFYTPYILVYLYQGEELYYVETKRTIHSTIRVAMQPTAPF
jgi:hypothetical protein